MKDKLDCNIDVVITWVDNCDKEWMNEKQKYSPSTISEFSNGENRFVDNGLLRYFFRGIEQFAPFINKIFFVTYGHLPKWLDVSNKRLEVIKHSDFIPKKYLPTFNSNTILLNIHRIKGLSDHFVVFNDDMFLIKKTKPSDFFKTKLPCDMAVQDIVCSTTSDIFWNMLMNNNLIINKKFKKKKQIKGNFIKWFNFKYGIKNCFKNFLLYPFNYFTGFNDTHVCNSYLKSTFIDVWEEYSDFLDNVCNNKFRTNEDLTEWLMRYWQLASGNFHPYRKDKFGTYCSLKSINFCKRILKENKYKCICLNDEFNNEKDKIDIITLFNEILPNKSSFEK